MSGTIKQMLGMAALALGMALGAAAQTTVTATITDPHGQLYANCQYNVVFVGQNTTPGAGPYLLSGSVFQQSFVGAKCSSSGVLSIPLWANSAISPTPSQWQFNFCDQTGKYCASTLVTVSTSSPQDISAALDAVAPILPTSGGGGLGDPGSNGIVYRSAFDTTRVSTSADVIGLWTGSCTASSFLRGDGACAAATVGSGTATKLPIWATSTTLGDSHVADNGTNVTSSLPLAVSGGSFQGFQVLAAGSGCTATAGNSAICTGASGDWQSSANGAASVHLNTSSNFKQVTSCGTTTTCSASALTTPQVVVGSVALSAGTATITGISPAFTSTSTFFCTSTDATDATKTSNVVPASASSITATGTGTDVIAYICAGN